MAYKAGVETATEKWVGPEIFCTMHSVPSRGVWGDVPPGNFWILGSIRSNLIWCNLRRFYVKILRLLESRNFKC